MQSARQASLDLNREALSPEVEEFAKSLSGGLARSTDTATKAALISRLRQQLRDVSIPSSISKLRSLFLRHVLLDLCNQGWSVKLRRDRLEMSASDNSGESLQAAKLRIQEQHLQERDAQLRESSVRDFIQQMERRRLTSVGWHSIFSVMRDGTELSQKLRQANEITDAEVREIALAACIDPYLQLVDSKTICTQTGLRLNDIWRYFRHTWTNSYRSTPGRSMTLLVRDRAAPNHPIIGIASLGSSVVQQSVRDTWIGWDAKGIVEEFCGSPTKTKARWLEERTDEQIDALYVRDLITHGFVTRALIKRPTEEAISVLMKESETAIKRHRLYPDKAQLK